MTDTQSLFLLLAVLYLVQCTRVVPSNSIVFTRNLLGRYTFHRPRFLFLQQRKALILCNPLIPPGSTFICTVVPLSLSPRVLVTCTSQWLGDGGRPDSPIETVDLGGATQVGHAPDQLSFADRNSTIALPLGVAESVIQVLDSFASCDDSSRSALIDKWLERQFAIDRIEERLGSYLRETWLARWSAYFMSILLLLALPILAWQFGLLRAVLIGAVPVIGLWIASVVGHWKAANSVYPEARKHFLGSKIEQILYWPATMRSCDDLSGPLLGQFHPLAVAVAVLPKERLTELAGRLLRDLENPLPPPSELESSQAREAIDLTRTLTLSRATALLASVGINPANLLQPSDPPPPSRHPGSSTHLREFSAHPQESSAGVQESSGRLRELEAAAVFSWYCPRCLTEYSSPLDFCADCPGISLRNRPKTTS